MTIQLSKAMGIPEDELEHIRRGALLHDFGKIILPDQILQKAGSFTDDERQLIQQHPAKAFELLHPIEYLRPALDIPHCHHEKWDGTGYPRRIGGEQIPLAARIFSVVDV